MKTKLEMAHEIAVAMQSQEPITDMKLLSALAWAYTDAMQAEADKRKKEGAEEESKKRKEVRQKLINTFESNKLHCSDDWQPDWSQAPDWANWWAMDENKNTRWIYSQLEQPYISDIFLRWCAVGRFDSADAPSFGYTGDWRNSLRKRPQ